LPHFRENPGAADTDADTPITRILTTHAWHARRHRRRPCESVGCSSFASSSYMRHLRSAERNPLHRLNTYGRPRAFAIAGPSAWKVFRTLSATRTPPKLLSGAC